MPNWVTNNVELFHEDQSVIDEVFDMLTDTSGITGSREDHSYEGCLTFKKLLPVPEVLDNVQSVGLLGGLPSMYVENGDGKRHTRPATDEEIAEIEATGFPDGYEWRIHHWGCKWDACQSTAAKGDRCISLRFDTPWAPPEPFVEALRKRWPEVEISGGWVEEGYQSCGQF